MGCEAVWSGMVCYIKVMKKGEMTNQIDHNKKGEVAKSKAEGRGWTIKEKDEVLYVCVCATLQLSI